MAHAEFESHSGVVRVWLDDLAVYGDPMQWTASVRWIDCESIEITGVMDTPLPSVWRALHNELRNIGIKRILIVRYKEHKRIKKWIEVK